MNRREALLSGAGLAAFTLVSPWASAVAKSQATLTAVVHDGRYADSRAFANAFAADGIESLSVQSGAVDLWRAHLRRLNGTRPMLAGMTSYADFTTLRLCAAELRLRTLHECVHDCRGATTLTHRIAGGDSQRLAQTLSVAGTRWQQALAATLASPATHHSAQQRIVSGLHRRSGDHPGTLVSWVLG